ncbi:MAG: MFS transporter [Dehalococcoidia bacterium]
MAESIPATTTDGAEEEVGSSVERNSVLWLTNFSHAVNHFQNEMLAVLYVTILPDLGFSYTQLGALTAIRSVFGGAVQGLYGFLTPFLPRAWILGITNVIMGLGTLATGFATSFNTFLGARAVAAVGGSAQHPVGYSLLAGYFPRARGAIIALNSSASNVGGLVAPLVAGALLLIMGWRQVFMIVALVSVAMGLVYFLFRKQVAPANDPVGGRGRLVQGMDSYLRVFHNKNVILVSLVMMVGGAGRGLTVIFLAQHFARDLGLSTFMVSIAITTMLAGGVVGPVALGWISDRVSRKGVIQVSLLLSTLATVWLAFQGAFLPLLLANMAIYGMVTRSRMSLTLAMVADSLPDADRDAAFSVFSTLGFVSAPLWIMLIATLMEGQGFTVAFVTISLSYLAGVFLMIFVKEVRSAPVRESTVTSAS